MHRLALALLILCGCARSESTDTNADKTKTFEEVIVPVELGGDPQKAFQVYAAKGWRYKDAFSHREPTTGYNRVYLVLQKTKD